MKKKKTILVIEDEKVLLRKIEGEFIKKNYNVITARNINEVFFNVFKKNKTNIVDINVIKSAIEHLKNLEQVDTIWLDHDVYDEKAVLNFIQKFEDSRPDIKKVPIFVISDKENKKIESRLNLNISTYYINKQRFDDIIENVVDSINSKLDYHFQGQSLLMTQATK